MFLVSAVFFGFVVWAAYLGLKRIAFYDRETPLIYIITIVMCITTEIILVLGINVGEWGAAITHLLAMYIGLVYAMKFVGDLSYYWAKYRPQEQFHQTQIPAEDDPNWLEYRYRA